MTCNRKALKITNNLNKRDHKNQYELKQNKQVKKSSINVKNLHNSVGKKTRSIAFCRFKPWGFAFTGFYPVNVRQKSSALIINAL